MRAEFKRKKQKWKDARSIGAPLSSPKDISGTWMNKVMKSNAHELKSRGNEAASRSSTGYDDAFVFYEEKCMAPVDT